MAEAEIPRTENLLNKSIVAQNVPITCVRILENVIAIAEGPSLALIKTTINPEVKSPNCVHVAQLFPNNAAIAGLELDCYNKNVFTTRTKGFCWAGNVGKIFNVDANPCQITDVVDLNFEYTPVAASWINDDNLTILTMSNEFVLLQIDGSVNESLLCTEKKRYIGESFNLFCGVISGHKVEDLIVFSGTVFDGIIAWKIDSQDKVSVLQVLKGHNGIPFSVNFFPDERILMSTSDDRSIVVWDYKPELSTECFKSKLRIFGHEARIWKSILVDKQFIISVGESSTVFIHKLDGTLFKSWLAHDGAPIYDCVYMEKTKTLFTVSHNGSVCQWKNCWHNPESKILPIDRSIFELESIDKSVDEHGRHTSNHDYPRSVVLFDTNHVIAAMESGRIVGISRSLNQFPIFYEKSLHRYCSMALSPTKQLLAFGGLYGHMYFLRMTLKDVAKLPYKILAGQKLWFNQFKSKVVTINWLCDRRLLVTCLDRSVVLQLHINEKQGLDVEFLDSFIISLKRPGIPAVVEIHGKYLVAGDETGNIHLLQIGEETPVFVSKGVHKEGVTSIVSCEGNKIATCGRNGVIKYFTLDANDAKLVEVSERIVPFEWIARLEYFEDMGLLATGFYKENFLIFSVDEDRVISTVYGCGNGHRRWDFMCERGYAAFSYLRDKEVMYAPMCLEVCLESTLKCGLHTKTVNAAVSLGLEPSKNSDTFLWATGSEDGDICLFSLSKDIQSFNLKQRMNRHASSVRTLECLQTDGSPNYYFLFSAGGRSELIVWRIDMTEKDVLLWNKTVLEKADKKAKEQEELNDSRIMSVSCLPCNDTVLCFCACSDGNVKCVQIPTTVKTGCKSLPIVITFEGIEHTVMKIRAFRRSPDSNVVTIIGVTSNGKILIWIWNSNSDPVIKPVFSQDIRRCALMCFDIKFVNENNKLSIVIGGDDCSISLWTISFVETTDSNFSLSNIWIADQIQRSSVVSLKFNRDVIYSCSNDQILACWNVVDGKLIWNLYAGVSDCQGFVPHVDDKLALCYGNGVSLVKLPNGSL